MHPKGEIQLNFESSNNKSRYQTVRLKTTDVKFLSNEGPSTRNVFQHRTILDICLREKEKKKAERLKFPSDKTPQKSQRILLLEKQSI